MQFKKALRTISFDSEKSENAIRDYQRFIEDNPYIEIKSIKIFGKNNDSLLLTYTY